MDNRGGALAVRRRVLGKLVRGREVATQLQNLIDKPVRDRGAVDVADLGLQIFRSFADALSELTSPRGDSTPISSATSKKSPQKNRRGCYKRRRTSDSRTFMSSSVADDGRAWRKYGQKDILNSEFPRCYYRCTHKQQGCKALKQVQQMKQDPMLYQITYIGDHTCSSYLHSSSRPPYGLIHPTNIISFQSNTHGLEADRSPDDDDSPTVLMTIDYNRAVHVAPTATPSPSLVKEEETTTDTQSDDHQDSKSDAKSSLLQDALRQIIGAGDAFEYCSFASWEEGASCGSSGGFHDDFHQMEIINGQFPDIETLYFDD